MIRVLIALTPLVVATAVANVQPPPETPTEIIATQNEWQQARLFSFRTAGVEDCYITPELRIGGSRRIKCIEHLETAARLARAEWRVNEATKRKR